MATNAAPVVCSSCGAPASVHAHTGHSPNSSTTPRCKSAKCSKVCRYCWGHFVPGEFETHVDVDAGWGRGCAAGPAPDPLKVGE